MLKNKFEKNIFKKFDFYIKKDQIPEKFTYPFNYEPHDLCLKAASELQDYILTRKDWEYDFGINNRDFSVYGKMFGVLVVKSPKGEIGYLSAHSGKLAGRNDHAGFVPPVVNLLNNDGFYRKEEAVISDTNEKIKLIENNEKYKNVKCEYDNIVRISEVILNYRKKEVKDLKSKRKNERLFAYAEYGDEYLVILKKVHRKISLDSQYSYKRLKKYYEKKIARMQYDLLVFEKEISNLKKIRKKKSQLLQKEIFSRFSFLNALKQEKTLYDIFSEERNSIPPAGAGDCAAPKLLEYAYQNNYYPLAMAEFWWGKSPKSIVRKHKYFYPSCKSKCEPILNHMLKGLEVDDNPMEESQSGNRKIKIVYEDGNIVLINKPHGLLTVPGKKVKDSVTARMRDMYPDCKNIKPVHRLDMSTSGLIIVAKDENAYKNIQKQFIDRTICKTYIALLQNNIDKRSGRIELPIRVDLDNRPSQMVCYEYGKPAITDWKYIGNWDGHARVCFAPLTGRTHQLRVHSAHLLGLNNPILGDEIYGKKLDRLYLHAYSIEFDHPETKKRLKFSIIPDF